MGDLTAHFSRWEFADPEHPDGWREINLGLLRGLELLRQKVGLPIRVTSGLRILDLGSFHSEGTAADVACRCSLRVLYELALGIEVFSSSGVGLYPQENFVHVDVGRSIPYRWVRIAGTYYYW